MNVITATQAVERIARNVSFAMAKERLTVRAFAQAIEEPVTSVHRLIHGENEARISLVAKVAEHFGVRVDDLLLPATQFQRRLEKSRPTSVVS